MPKAVFVEHNGTEHSVEGPEGKSLMQIAVDSGVPGIVGDCGGCASCGTCQGYVAEPWLGKLAPPDETELSMLDGVLRRKPNSRLTCQIRMKVELDGIRVDLPESQL
jgi:2Fe-2S ferredoxin